MRPLLSLGLVAVLLAAAPGARAAGPDATDWQASSKSRARLVSDGAGGARRPAPAAGPAGDVLILQSALVRRVQASA